MLMCGIMLGAVSAVPTLLFGFNQSENTKGAFAAGCVFAVAGKIFYLLR